MRVSGPVCVPSHPLQKETFFKASCLESGGRASSVWAGLRAKNNVPKTLDIFLLTLEI